MLHQVLQSLLVAYITVQLAKDPLGNAHVHVGLLEEVWPAVEKLVVSLEQLSVDTFAMLGEVDSDRLKVRQSQALFAQSTLGSPLIRERRVQIADLAKNIALEVEGEVVG